MNAVTSASSLSTATALPAVTHDADASASTSSLLTLSGLTVDFHGHRAVDALDLRINTGELMALVGESGSGKSTVALAAMGLLPTFSRITGTIRFDGQDLRRASERSWRALRGNRIGMIFQEPMTSLNPLLTVGQQIAEALTLHTGFQAEPGAGWGARLKAGLNLPLNAGFNRRPSADEVRRQVLDLLDLVKIPDARQRIDHYPHQLSGGQRQRVMIAIAVANRPALLVADEPTTALDVTVQAHILSLIDELRRELNMAVLLITHDLGLVSRWADKVAVMQGGRKVEEAASDVLFRQPAHAYTRDLLAASLHFGDGRHYRNERLTEVGTRTATPVRRQQELGDVLLAVENLNVTYGGRHGLLNRAAHPVTHAVNSVSFSIQRGATVGLVGESGCGKSSLSRALMHLLEPSGGRIVFDGEDVTHLQGRALKSYRRRVQMIFQDPFGSLNPRHTVEKILHLALSIHGVSERRVRDTKVRRMLDAVGLPLSALGRYPHEFSGGQRQRIGIARALVLEPELVICDEPVSALDVSIQAQVLNLLVDLKADFNLSLLFISHDLSVVRYIADHVLVMQSGEIVESANHARIWTSPQHAYTRSLIHSVPSSTPLSERHIRKIQHEEQVGHAFKPAFLADFGSALPG